MRACTAITVGLLAAGCGTAHTARPLGRGNQAVHVSVGGPVVGVGSPDTFLPLTTLTYKVGITERADVFVGWHVLETFLNGGNLFFDLGASYYLFNQRGARPGLSTAFTVSPFLNARSGWAMLDLQVTASWAIGRRERHLVYVGAHHAVMPVRQQAIPTAPFTFSPYVGGQLRVGKKREMGLGLEVKWHRPYASTKESVIGYVGIGDLGALSFLGGITLYLGKDRKPAPVVEPEPPTVVEPAPPPVVEPAPPPVVEPETPPAPETPPEPEGAP